MSELTVSKYINNSPCGRKKHIYSRLLDYFSLFIVSYIFFTIFYSAGIQTPVIKNLNRDYKAASRKVMDYIDSSRLLSYNEKKNDFIDTSETAKAYLLNLTKTSAYIHQMQIPEYLEDKTYIMVDVKYEDTFMNDSTNYPLDNLSYYFNIFKKTDSKLNNYVIKGVDYKDDIETYQYNKAMIISDQSYHVESSNEDYIARGEGISTYLVLTNENTEKMINRVIKGEKIDDESNKLYNKLYNAYCRGVDFGTNDIENHSKTYLQLNAKFKSIYQSITMANAVIYFISYAIAFVVLNGMTCLISKDWVTIGQKVMGLGLSDVNEHNLSWWRILVYELVNFVLFFSSSIVAFYFMGMFGVLSYQILPGFTLLAVLSFLLVLNVFSFGMVMFSNKHNDLSTLAGGILIKDKNEFETSPEDDLINISPDQQEENDSGRE